MLGAIGAHREAEAALEQRLQVGEVGIAAGGRDEFDRTVRGREQLLHGVEAAADDRLVDRLAGNASLNSGV